MTSPDCSTRECGSDEECCFSTGASTIPTSAGGHWMAGRVDTPVGGIPKVECHLRFADRLGSWQARWNIGRMNYSFKPGLYAVGEPTAESPVFVSANYKMSFDALRSRLSGMSAWILVLDTHGINVWCAAGKGTFGTDEIVKRVEETRLSEIVSHRRLIVPQLGAPGVCAHQVEARCGFRVVYGPVRAADIPRFVERGFDATPDMRKVRFDFVDRLVLTPLEIVTWGRRALWGKQGRTILFALLILSALDRQGLLLAKAQSLAPWSVGSYVVAFFCGTLFTPLLLPWLPGRAFSLKGALVGLVAAVGIGLYRWDPSAAAAVKWNIAAWLVLLPAISSFIAVSFVGASTYTSLSGVFREMKRAVPMHIAATVVGVVLLGWAQFA